MIAVCTISSNSIFIPNIHTNIATENTGQTFGMLEGLNPLICYHS